MKTLDRFPRLNRLSLLMLLFSVFGIAEVGTAQTPTPTPTPDLRLRKVVESQIVGNGIITIVIDDLHKWLETPENDPKKFVLHLDGKPFNQIPSAISLTDGNGKPILDDKGQPFKALRFDLVRDSNNREAWTAVFGRRRPDEFSNRYVSVTVQQEGVRVSGAGGTNLQIIDWTSKRFWLFILSALGFIAFCWWLCVKTDMIRAPGPEPKSNDLSGKPHRKMYSLARTQMAFWFFVVILSYVFIWMVTGYLSNLPVSVLALIGISTATGLSSAVVDSGKRTEQETKLRNFKEQLKNAEADLQRLESEKKTIAANIATNIGKSSTIDLNEQNNALVDREGKLAEKNIEINQLNRDISALNTKLQPCKSGGFIHDILSDDDGVSFHRLQILGWTLVLILIFVVWVYDVLAMPEFDTTLLALMGISGGTYIGFKLPNQQG